jgi:hypothetical protein
MSQNADAPRIPFTGPVKANVVINKKDTHTGYTLELKFIQQRHQGYSDLLSFAINTPGSAVDREISTELFINRAERSVNYKLKSPWKTINFDGMYIFDIYYY